MSNGRIEEQLQRGAKAIDEGFLAWRNAQQSDRDVTETNNKNKAVGMDKKWPIKKEREREKRMTQANSDERERGAA